MRMVEGSEGTPTSRGDQAGKQPTGLITIRSDLSGLLNRRRTAFVSRIKRLYVADVWCLSANLDGVSLHSRRSYGADRFRKAVDQLAFSCGIA